MAIISEKYLKKSHHVESTEISLIVNCFLMFLKTFETVTTSHKHRHYYPQEYIASNTALVSNLCSLHNLWNRQGCQLPDFSLRSHTICDTANSPMTYSHPITEHPARTLEFQYFYIVLQKEFCGLRHNVGTPGHRCLFNIKVLYKKLFM